MDASAMYSKVLSNAQDAAGEAENFPDVPGMTEHGLTLVVDKWHASFYAFVKAGSEDERDGLIEQGKQTMLMAGWDYQYVMEQDDDGLLEKFSKGDLLAFIQYDVVRQPQPKSYYEQLTEADLAALVQAGE